MQEMKNRDERIEATARSDRLSRPTVFFVEAIEVIIDYWLVEFDWASFPSTLYVFGQAFAPTLYLLRQIHEL
jgi:hypothetical protein